MRAYKTNSVYFSPPTIWRLDTLKRIEKIIRESAFDKRKKKPGLKFNLVLALAGVRTTGPYSWASKAWLLLLNYPLAPPFYVTSLVARCKSAKDRIFERLYGNHVALNLPVVRDSLRDRGWSRCYEKYPFYAEGDVSFTRTGLYYSLACLTSFRVHFIKIIQVRIRD